MNFIVPSTSLFSPKEPNHPLVSYESGKFFVTESGTKHHVEKIHLSKELRDVAPETLKKLCSVGYLAIKKTGEDYGLQFNVRGPGGGPWTAIAVLVTGKVVGAAMMCFPPTTAAGVAVFVGSNAVAAAALVTPTP